MITIQKYLLICLLIGNSLVSYGALKSSSSIDSISLSITIKNGSNLPVNISTPVDGCFFIGQWTKVKTNKDGEINVRLPLDSSGFCQIWLNYLPWVGRVNCIQIYAEPGETYSVFLEKGNEFESIIFSGDNVPENKLLNSFKRYRVDYWGQSEYLKSILPHSPKKSILEIVDNLQKSDLESVNLFQKNQTCSDAFINLLKEDIHYYYSQLFYVGWSVKSNELKSEPDSKEMTVWNEDLKTIMARSPIDNSNALGSCWYNDYKNVIWLRYFPEALDKLEKSPKDSVNMLIYKIVTSSFKGEVREQHLASIIRSNAIKNKFSKTVQEQYIQFRTEYPFSPFFTALEKEFEEVLKTGDAIKGQPSPFSQKNISTLNELIQIYPNQILYIDIWASWCGPCKQEFAEKNDEVESFLTANNIQQIFITIDDSTNLRTATEIISFYHLEGEHFLASKALIRSIEETLNDGKRMPVPRYFIVNKQGKIVIKNAKRPSSTNDLIEQLKQVIE